MINSGGTVPTLNQLGREDASVTAAAVFNGDHAVWSGNLLFVLLGDDNFFRATLLEKKADAYDLLAAFKSASTAVGATSGVVEVFTRLGELLFTGITDLGLVTRLAASINTFFYDTYGSSYLWPRNGIVLDVIGRNGDLSVLDQSTVLLGADGDDTIRARDKSGMLDVQADLIDGGEGKDRVTYAATDGLTVTIETAETEAVFVATVDKTGILSGDSLFNVEEIIGSGKADEFILQAIDARQASLTLAGGGDDDTIKVKIAPEGDHKGRSILDFSKIVYGGSIAVEFREFELMELEGAFSDVVSVSDMGLRNMTLGLVIDLGVSGSAVNAAGERMVDSIDASEMSSAVTIDLSNAARQTLSSAAGSATFKNAEGARGSNFDDVIKGGPPGGGDSRGMALIGGGGRDTITGGSGDDRIVGWDDSDVDTLRGGGSDLFLAGANDIIQDPARNDEIRYKSGGSAMRMSLAPADGVPIGDGSGARAARPRVRGAGRLSGGRNPGARRRDHPALDRRRQGGSRQPRLLHQRPVAGRARENERQRFPPSGGRSNPRADAAAILIEDWQEITRRTTVELLGQTALGARLMPGLRFAGAAFFQVDEGTSLGTIVESLAANLPQGSLADQAPYWHVAMTSLEQYRPGLGVTQAEVFAAVDALPQVWPLGLTASELAKLSVAGDANGVVIGTGTAQNTTSGSDVLMSDVAGATLDGMSGNDLYVLSSAATGTKIVDSSGRDRLVLLDLARGSISVTATLLDDDGLRADLASRTTWRAV